MKNDWMVVIPPKVNPNKLRHRKKSQKSSFHREDKTYAHTTINGVGVVGRLRINRNKFPIDRKVIVEGVRMGEGLTPFFEVVVREIGNKLEIKQGDK